MAVPTFKLLNGRQMPMMALGSMDLSAVFVEKDLSATEKAIEAGIDAGYRHFDTAFVYFNEKQVGNAIRKKIKEGKVKREDIFVTTKLSMQFLRPENVAKGVNASLAALDLDYIDMYIIHGTIAWKYIEGNPMPFDDKGKLMLDDPVDPLDTWKELEKFYKAGKLKGIGLSNFNSKQVKRIYDNAEIKPMNLQIELSAYLPQYEFTEFCQKLGIAVTAWSPLGAPWRANLPEGTPFQDANVPKQLEHPTIVGLAKKYKKSPAQIVLRWITQRGICPIPKSSNPDRIKENISIFDFKLDDADMKSMNLGIKQRLPSGALDHATDHPHYPYHEPF